MKTMFRGFQIVVLSLAVCMLGACGRGPTNPDIVTLALDIAPTNLDPRIGTDASSERLTQLIFNSLVRKDGSSSVVPDLALTWEMPDPTTYVFHLREGVRFHDGRPLTAHDVVYTFRTIMDGTVQTAKAGTYRIVQAVEAVDDWTVRFRLEEPFAPFLWNLSLGAIGIVPEGSGLEFSDHPIGSGPFVFEHYVRDGEVLLRANLSYFGERPKLEAVRFKIVPDAVVLALELRKGTVDIGLNVLPPDMVVALADQPHLEILRGDGTNYQYLAFNLEDPIFRDVRVRKAIAHAVDREAIVRYLWRNQARLADSLLPPGKLGVFLTASVDMSTPPTERKRFSRKRDIRTCRLRIGHRKIGQDSSSPRCSSNSSRIWASTCKFVPTSLQRSMRTFWPGTFRCIRCAGSEGITIRTYSTSFSIPR